MELKAVSLGAQNSRDRDFQALTKIRFLSLKKDSCTENYSSCVRSCPCEKNCPEGCVNCENEICKRLPFFNVLGDQPFTDRTQYVMATDGSEKMETSLVIPESSNRHDYLK